MKKIVLHSATTDNAGLYCDAGRTLEVRAIGEDGNEGAITNERADEMIRNRTAVTPSEAREEAQPPAVEPKTKRKRTQRKPARSVAPVAPIATPDPAPPAGADRRAPEDDGA